VNIACTKTTETIRMSNKRRDRGFFRGENSSVGKEAECRSRDAC
jgi:hypothetical protein